MVFSNLADRLKYIASTRKMTLYHGTKTQWNGFADKKQQSGYYPGFYTSTKKDMAESFGNVVSMTGDLNIYNLTDAGELKNLAAKAGFGRHSGNGQAEVEYLKSKGYDGLSRGQEVIVFNTGKLKVN